MREWMIKLLANSLDLELLSPDSRNEIILTPKLPVNESKEDIEQKEITQKKLKITEKLLPVYPYCRNGRALRFVRGIVVHWVENPDISANGVYKWFSRNQEHLPEKKRRYASTHYVIGKRGEVIQMLPEGERAHHVGARKYMKGIQAKLGNYPNAYTLGIECCHEDWTGKMTDATYESLVTLCKDLLHKYELDAKDLYLHYHVTGKKCHRWFINNPEEWKELKSRISKRLYGL